MLRWCGPSCPTRMKSRSKSMGWNSANDPPISRRSMISMPTQVLRSDSPHMGNPAAVSKELPTIRFVASPRPSEPGRAVTVDELFQGHGSAGGRIEVFVGNLAGDRIAARIRQVEEIENLPLLLFDFLRADGALLREQVVNLRLHDVEAKLRGECRLVRMHVQHRLNGMSEVADSRTMDIVEHLGDLAPLP